METKLNLENALKDAMRAQSEPRKRAIRSALSAIKLAEVEKGGPLDDLAVTGMLQKEVKSRRETIADAQKAGRPDLIALAEEEISILEEFLPQPLTDAELQAAAQAVIAEVGATVPNDMGKVMKELLPRLQGRAANDRVSQTVRKLLQS
ncbi:MAG TPA: GatB/YqeY domain-containing protein [Anaerolineaceae bacterium]